MRVILNRIFLPYIDDEIPKIKEPIMAPNKYKLLVNPI